MDSEKDNQKQNITELIKSDALNSIYFNEFGIGVSKHDIVILLRRNGKEEAILNASNITAKSLVRSLGEALNRFESTTNQTIQNSDEIDRLSTFEEIIKYGIDAIKLKDDYFVDRIRELKALCDEEEYNISLESLKTMFLFVGTVGSISKPSSLTVSENGLFYLEWERDRNNSITIRFKQDYFLEYVIFKPSLHINKRIILNGSMYVLDFVDYLNDLNLKIHKTI